MIWIFITLTIMLIASLYPLKKKMNGLTIIGCFMFSNIMIELSGIIISINLELTKTPNESISLWTQKIASIGTKPLIIVWLIYFIFANIKIIYKLFIVLLFIVVLVSFELLFIKVGFLIFENWNTFYESLRYLLIIILTVIYVRNLEKMMKKEMMIPS